MSAVSRCLPSLDAVSRSACCAGASAVCCRLSGRALEGVVFAVGFRRHAAASAFAARWAVRLPAVCRGCCVRHELGFWFVSVPVLAESAPCSFLVYDSVPQPLFAFGSPASVRRQVVTRGAWS